jgi:hypothetical protein
MNATEEPTKPVIYLYDATTDKKGNTLYVPINAEAGTPISLEPEIEE